MGKGIVGWGVGSDEWRVESDELQLRIVFVIMDRMVMFFMMRILFKVAGNRNC